MAYIDWVNDKYDLKRQWCNASTAEVIRERIKQSTIFILFLSKSTLNSQWCPWELGYADALGKKICVYMNNADLSYIPQFYSMYDRLLIENDQIFIDTGKEKKEYIKWL